MDLTKNAPRSVSTTMLGIVQLARTVDIAKALAHGHVGEYKYDSSTNRELFEYLGMDSKEFLNIVKSAKSDSEIEAYAKTFIAKKDPRSIEAFNKKRLSEVPTGESLKHFNELRSKIAPNRTDVTTWPDLLDLEEGRTVPQRETVHA
ncbi:MAG TPA: DUF5069 domain-containing protein [Candidatus Baltobacteraceae bacterium]|nr:DUF5069 domain-containing protein [Candidatus Baltobacteraceae bacterium]